MKRLSEKCFSNKWNSDDRSATNCGWNPRPTRTKGELAANSRFLGQARGVALLCAVETGADVHEYTPNQVKLSVTGYGAATKGQMLKMVQSLLATRELPRSDDAIDALAIAICHHHSGRLRSIISRAPAGVRA